ncbi:MAG: phosphoadenosine phosphosulfate reductase family protein [Victivallaceae bacterium]
MSTDREMMDFNLHKLRIRQAYPLDLKIEFSLRTIWQWNQHYDGGIYVSFSGGKDSTVLLHLVRVLAGLKNVPAVFCDTGLEYPEIREFVRSSANVTTVRPRLSFKQVIEKYGYPVISKRVAQYIHEVQAARDPDGQLTKLRLTGLKKDGKYTQMGKIPDKWIPFIKAPFKIDCICCDKLKKQPLNDFNKSSGRVPYIGMMSAESKQREVNYMIHGCNSFEQKFARSTPLAWWTEADIWEYLRRYNVPYSSIYNMGYERTGCMFCMFGLHLENRRMKNNRFQKMQKTHPQLYEYCMDKLGCRRVCQYMGIPYEYVPEFEAVDMFDEKDKNRG